MGIHKSLVALVMLACCSHSAYGQARASCSRLVDIGDHDLSGAHATLARALSATRLSLTATSATFRAAGSAVPACADSLPFLENWKRRPLTDDARFNVVPAVWETRTNSKYPRARNDGAMQTAVGFNTSIHAGLAARWQFLTVSLAPYVSYHENADFAFPASILPDRSEFANPDHFAIDWPKRYGRGAYRIVDLGQSFIRVDYGPISAAFSNENLWLGPAQVLPMLLSNTAPGFPHLRVGTTRPIRAGPLNLEANLFWASVQESEYFDGNPDNDNHLFAGTAMTISPRFLPNLHLGIARVYHDINKATGQSLGYYLSLIAESPFYVHGGNRPGNGIGGAFFRWVLPESGFEVYGEWTAEDTPGNLEMALRQPDDTRAYTLGLQKVFASPQRVWRVFAEQAVLGQSATIRSGRGFYSVYTHADVPQGHTHRGELLGAAIGPGSDAQILGFDVFGASGRSGMTIERVRYDDDTYYRVFARQYGEVRHDVEVSAEARHLRFVGQFTIEGVLRASHRYDRDFQSLRIDGAQQIETNWGTELRLTWRP